MILYENSEQSVGYNSVHYNKNHFFFVTRRLVDDTFVRAKKRNAKPTTVAHFPYIAIRNIGSSVTAECYSSTTKIKNWTLPTNRQQQ